MSCAVLVIDMQNGFCHVDGSLPRSGFGLPDMPAVIRENAALLAAARPAGLPLLYTRHVYRPDFLDAPPRQFTVIPRSANPLVRGSWDADIVDELAPAEGDVIIDKNRYDAFLYTDLEVILRTLGVTRLLIGGVVTSVCVESTVRSAEQRGFDVHVARDCTSAPADAQEASLASMGTLFATIGTWRELLPELTATPTA